MHSLVDELCASALRYEKSLAADRGPDPGGTITLWVHDTVEAWCEALRACFSLARGERARELNGDRSVRRFDEQGLHPFSAEWGRLMALEALLPGLSDVREKHQVDDDGEAMVLFVSPRVLRHEAYEAAERERLARTTLDVVERLGLDRAKAASVFAELGIDPTVLS